MNNYAKIGWIALSGIAVIAFVTIMLFNYEILAVTQDEETEDVVEQSEVSTTEEVKQFIEEMHLFYNETTGYGNIKSLDWNEQSVQAEQIVDITKKLEPSIEKETLASDFREISHLAQLVMSKQDEKYVRQLHRYFHDLDIAMNDYSGYKEIWNVTETLHAQ